MGLRIHNSMSGRKEEFAPLEPGHVRMYVCGITVYDHIHVGHARSQIAFDVARRWLRASGYRVTYVRNITDIDDNIINRARERGEPVEALTARFIAAMNEDFAAIGLESPDHEPRATEFIPEIVAMIGRLIDGGHAYVGVEWRRLLFGRELPEVRAALRQEARGPARRRARRGRRVETRPARFRALEAREARRASLGLAVGDGPPGLAHRMLGDGGRAAWPRVRHPRRRHGPEVPASRERNRPDLCGLQRAVRKALDAQRLRARGRREDVEVARQLLHRARSAAAPAPGGPARLPARLALPGAGELHGRQPAAGRCLAAAPLPRAAGRRAATRLRAGRSLARILRGDGRRFQHPGGDRRAAVGGPRAQRRQGRRRPRTGEIIGGGDPPPRRAHRPARARAGSLARDALGARRRRGARDCGAGSDRDRRADCRHASRRAARATSPSPTASATGWPRRGLSSRTAPPALPGAGNRRGRSPLAQSGAGIDRVRKR